VAEFAATALRRVRDAQERLGQSRKTFGLIHADIHQNNYLFEGTDVRLLDFGDCGWGHYLYDLAVTLECLDRMPSIAGLRSALLAGYREIRDLPAEHEELIDAFCLLRRVQDML
jgi:Ser/Thr protein kinase RdoA (MazF antagonist)